MFACFSTAGLRMKATSHVSCTNMLLFDLEPNHKPILKCIVHETRGLMPHENEAIGSKVNKR